MSTVLSFVDWVVGILRDRHDQERCAWWVRGHLSRNGNLITSSVLILILNRIRFTQDRFCMDAYGYKVIFFSEALSFLTRVVEDVVYHFFCVE